MRLAAFTIDGASREPKRDHRSVETVALDAPRSSPPSRTNSGPSGTADSKAPVMTPSSASLGPTTRMRKRAATAC